MLISGVLVVGVVLSSHVLGQDFGFSRQFDPTPEQLEAIRLSSLLVISRAKKNDLKLHMDGVDQLSMKSCNEQHRRIQLAQSEAKPIQREGEVEALCTLKLKQMFNLSNDFFVSMKNASYHNKKHCPFKKITCTHVQRESKYRTADGQCNNLDYPIWGKSFTPLIRHLGANYSDGLSSPRVTGVKGEPLPSAHDVSKTVHEASQPRNLDRFITHMVMQFGQFLDHDLSHSPVNQETKSCCLEDIRSTMNVTQEMLNNRPDCFPIFPDEGSERCMHFVRSIASPNIDCSLGPREQLNQLTSYIDGSQIYGSTKYLQLRLRLMTDGMLKYETFPGYDHTFLMQDKAACDVQSVYCPLAGDHRVSEHGGLTSMQTVWMREHNRLANELKEVHGDWDDNRLFQEARRIVIAELQHIVYNEFLPVILGEEQMEIYGIKTSAQDTFFTGYNKEVNAQISNSFTTAAYRMGHSLISDEIIQKDITWNHQPDIQNKLRDMFNRPDKLLTRQGPDSILAGLASNPAQSVDRLISTEIKDHLFEDDTGRAMDLAALNIQRGRDHGLPGYLEFRKFCNLSIEGANKWALLGISKLAIGKMKTIFRNVEDIDLFTAGMSEEPVPHGLVGPTFACLIGDQFRRLKQGDRFFYENMPSGEPHNTQGFTLEQLNRIRRVSLTGIICKNTDIIELQENIFHPPGARNHPRSCRHVFAMDGI